MVDVEDAPEVLQRLRRLLVFHGQHELEEPAVVHFAFECLVFFVDAVDEDVGEAPRVLGELGLFEGAVAVGVELDVLFVDGHGILRRKPA